MENLESLKDTLNARYRAVFESPEDSYFYQNIHAYIDFIVKTPKLCAIIDKSDSDYHKEFTRIWTPRTDDEKENDLREERVYRTERFSLFASHYCTLLVRIYWPIEDYKNPEPEFEDKLDPVAILMLRGFDRAVRMNLWRKETLKTYNRWFDGKRKMYENDLRQFHVDFLTAMQELEKDNTTEILPEPEKEKLPLVLHPRTGDFSFYGTRGNFVPTGQEFKVLNTLYNSPDYQASYLDLLKSFKPHLETASKPDKQELYLIINRIKEKLCILPKCKNINFDIFDNVQKLGYRLVFKASEEKPKES